MVYSSIASSYFDEFPFRRHDRWKASSGYFFLSHAHSDHTSGLKSILTDPDATLVCSHETAAIIKVIHNIPREKCLIIKPNQSLSFDKFIVHALDANHCLGSLLFVIESSKGLKEVYTGDFRLGPPIMDELNLLQGANHLWVDYTYGKESLFQFPSREKIISEILTFILSEGDFPEKDIWIAAYKIGKELLLKTISEALKTKIWASDQKVKIYKEIGGEWDFFTNDQECFIRVGSRRMVEDLKGIKEEDKAKMMDALRISPTGWAIRLNNKRLDVHFFPYSDHCSFSEVRKFIELVKAKNITYI
ncbi:MAG: MBL fold metallo-hydrolase [Candidatus Hodarchaeota archaeon]